MAVGELGDLPAVATHFHLLKTTLLSERTRAYLKQPPQELIDSDLAWAGERSARLIASISDDYPPLLAAIKSAPAVLYVLGDAASLLRPQLAMVGARGATATGRAIARELAGQLARLGIAVTSGLALGIDTACHEGALAAEGQTIAVCAHGLDRLYPPQNRELARRILTSGALVSELPPGTPTRRENFPRRNRILSGLALGTLVVEAAPGSGSLLTAHFAAEQGREVFAVPGSIRNPLARGCHQLLREGATLVESAEDVLRAVKNSLINQDLASIQGGAAVRPQAAPALDKEYEMLLDALGFEPVSINTLVERTALPSGSIASMLLILELGGRVAPHPGGRFCRLS